MKKEREFAFVGKQILLKILKKVVPFILISFGSETINIFLTFLDLTLVRRIIMHKKDLDSNEHWFVNLSIICRSLKKK